jgi:TldD protein
MSRAVDLAQSSGAQYADIRVVENRTESIQVKNGVVESLNFAESRGFGIRVLVKGAWGFSSCIDLCAD